jgi:hypothetical protein
MPISYKITLAGLTGLLFALPWWLVLNTDSLGLIGLVVLGAIVPIALLIVAGKRSRNWSGITALFMIPLSSMGIMDIVADLRASTSGMVLAVLAIGVFLAALDAGRRLNKPSTRT